MAVNRPTAPFIVRDGAPENVDLVAEWRIVDATWYETFAKARLNKVFKVLIKLDEHAREVRAVDHELSVEWRAGFRPGTAEAFRGQTKKFSFGTALLSRSTAVLAKFTATGSRPRKIKTPLQDAVTKAGWTRRGVAFGKL